MAGSAVQEAEVLIGVEAAVGQRQGRLGEGGRPDVRAQGEGKRPAPPSSGHSAPHGCSRRAGARFRGEPSAPSAGRPSVGTRDRSGALQAAKPLGGPVFQVFIVLPGSGKVLGVLGQGASFQYSS